MIRVINKGKDRDNRIILHAHKIVARIAKLAIPNQLSRERALK